MIERQVDLYNTPGIYYAAAYWLAAMLLIAFVPTRKKGAGVRAIQAAVLVILSICMTLTHHAPVILFLPLQCCYVFMLGCMVYESCGMNVMHCAYLTARAFILGELAAALDWQLFHFALTTLRMPLNMKTNLLFLVPTFGLVFGTAAVTEKILHGEDVHLEIGKNEMAILIVIIAISYTLSNISYVLKGTPFTTEHAHELFVIRTMADLMGVGLSFAYHLLLRENRKRYEAESMQALLKMQYDQYRISEESMALVNQKYHDLKHQITLLKSGASDETRLAYLEAMEADIRRYEAENRTGCGVLDAILQAKMLLCQKKDITMTSIVDGEKLSFMRDIDISALFGNMLDNAIEGVEEVEKKEERLIRLSVTEKQGFLKIGCENRCRGHVTFQGGLPVTSKSDSPGFHGYGVRSIKTIAESYGGSLRVGCEDGWFTVSVLIPSGGGVQRPGRL